MVFIGFKGISVKLKILKDYISTKLKVSNGFKSSTMEPELIVVIIEHSQTFSYQRRRLDYAPDTRPHKEHQILSGEHLEGLIM